MTVRRRLVVVRHAKSAWDDEALADHDRPLAPRGVRALDRMRAHVDGLELPALVVLCSTARRAVATFDGIRGALPDDAVVERDRSIYAADAATLLGRIRMIGDEFASAMIVGHNPALQDLVVDLVGSGDAEARRRIAGKLPTGAIVNMSFEGHWRDLAPGSCSLDDLFTPR